MGVMQKRENAAGRNIECRSMETVSGFQGGERKEEYLRRPNVTYIVQLPGSLHQLRKDHSGFNSTGGVIER